MWFRRAFLTALGLFLVVGLLGFLGVRSRTVTAVDGPLVASVEYAQVARGGLAAPYTISVRNADGFTGPIEITVDQSYLQLFDQNGIDPQPDGASSDGSHVTYEFDPPDGTAFTLTFDVRIGPSVQSGTTGHTEVASDGRRVELEHHTWVMP